MIGNLSNMYGTQYKGPWHEWECPLCGSVQEDPEDLAGETTTCRNNHMVRLVHIEDFGWAGIALETQT